MSRLPGDFDVDGGFTTVNTLTQLAKGGRVGFPHVMRFFRWLGRPAGSFTRITFR
jgi:hypothetical protein